jgi:hypothetical protein
MAGMEHPALVVVTYVVLTAAGILALRIIIKSYMKPKK